MRKALSILLCMIIVAGVFNVSYAKSEKSYDVSEKAEMLNKIGITWKTKNGKIDYDAIVSRREAATLFSGLITNKSLMIKNNCISDMNNESEDDFAYEEILKVTENGVMRLYDDGSFVPDKGITYDEFLYAAVKILGYSPMAEFKGGYPLGYRITASDIGLGTNISLSPNEYLRGYQVIELLTEIIDIDVMKVKLTNGEIIYDTVKDKTILSENFNVYKIKGQITENGFSSLTGESSIEKNEVKIDDIVVKIGDTGADFLLGYNVTGYYKENDDEDYTLLYIKADRKNELFIYANQIEDFSERKLYYYDETYNSLKAAKISQKAKVIYNGKAISDYSDEMMMPDVGDVTLIKTNGDEYDIVIIAEYDNYVVYSIDFEDNYVNDVLDASKKLAWTDDTEIRIYDKSYNVIEKEEIGYGSVLSIAKSNDNDLMFFIVVKENLEGTIKNLDKKEYEVIIDDKSYSVAPNAYSLFDKLTIGDEVKVAFDIDGNVAYYTKDLVGKYKPVYVIKVINDTIEDKFYLRILDDVVKTVECAEKLTIDGEKVTSKSYMESIIHQGEPALIKVNGQGLITGIDTAYSNNPKKGESRDSLHFVSGITSKTWFKPTIMSFSGKFLVSSGTKVFVIPDEMENYDEYYTATGTMFGSKTYSNVTAYSIEEGAEYVDYIVYKSSDDLKHLEDTNEFYVVSKITSIVDEDNNLVHNVSYYDKTGNVKEIVSNVGVELSDVETGDIIQIASDGKGRMAAFVKVFDKRTKEVSVADGASYSADVRSLYANVYKKMSCSLYLTTGNPVEVTNISGLEILPVMCTVMKYDSITNKVEKTSFAEINDYYRNGSDYSELFVRYTSGIPQMIVIYE